MSDRNRGAFPLALLETLGCPYCGSGLRIVLALSASDHGLTAGTLRCDCYEYPVVQGIPVLRQMSPASSTENQAVRHLHEGDTDAALRWLLEVGSGPGVPAWDGSRNGFGVRAALLRELYGRLPTRARRPRRGMLSQLGAFEAMLRASRPGPYADYLFHRFSNPSLLAAIPPALIVGDHCREHSRGRMLELMCGVGHLSATVSALRPDMEFVIADVDFVNLFAAGRFLAPRAAAVCIDVELPLPFSDDCFDGVYCLDGLHYVRCKTALLGEVDRVVGAQGAWLFSHLHNADGANVTPGAPLTASAYAARFAFGEQRLLPEGEVLRQFHEKASLDLTAQPPATDLDRSNALTFIGARSGALWKRYECLDDAVRRRPDLLWFNPLYAVEQNGDGMIARTRWPSDSLRNECNGGEVSLFPDTIHLTSGTVREIAGARLTGDLTQNVRDLLRSCVLVSLPECYARSGLPL